MKFVTIVGAGMGPDTVTAEGLRAIEEADVLFGAPRLLTDYAHLNKRSENAYTAEKMAPVLAEYQQGAFAVLVSGDVGFYSAADRLCRELTGCEVRVLPGISSLNCLAARLGRPWQGAALVSCHGRSGHLVDTVRRHAVTFALTGGNTRELAADLCRAGFGGLAVTVGEELGRPGERITAMTAEKLSGAEIGSLAVLLIDNPAADSRVRSGIPDGAFIRGDVPMTKAEVRAVTMSKLAVRPEDVCWDVGCGTGSVTVELALAAWRGHVYAIDKDEEAASLTEHNRDAFHLGNVTVCRGDAAEVLRALPAPDTVFVGGSGKQMGVVFNTVLEKNPRARIAVNAIALESAQAALDAFAAHNLPAELVQVGVSEGRAVAGLHMLTARNPIFIISGGGRDE
ncbi:MAG: precorrin-6y C5,15-methyltransferase (decarboxylating) subunit CbiE [Ruminococcaceae bacterium]|nr:precorrin-6y C5,15-methyltransferase (decarboxylating) subunit CbiE [Oscillospiraceae bacterium]